MKANHESLRRRAELYGQIAHVKVLELVDSLGRLLARSAFIGVRIPAMVLGDFIVGEALHPIVLGLDRIR